MNQILYTGFKEDKQNSNEINKNSLGKKVFKIQFFLSSFVVLVVISIFSFSMFSLKKKEEISNQIINNYNISKLYSDYQSKNENYKAGSNNIFGIIEIPKINLYYPIFSSLDEELLKIAPCKFYGGNPDENGNLCIAGHNYDNSLFFSNIVSLSADDDIFIYDNFGNKYIYKVYDIYEVNPSDLSPIYDYDENLKQLTLITCNNLNSKRIIVRAKQ